MGEINIKKEFLYMIEMDKFFDDFEKNKMKLKLFVDLPDTIAEYSGKKIDMSNISIKLKDKPKSNKKINIKRSNDINTNKSVF